MEPLNTIWPYGAIVTQFTYTPGSDHGIFNFTFSPTSGGFLGCPVSVGSDLYQVFAYKDGFRDAYVPTHNISDCWDFDAWTQPAAGPGAYEYL